jgi:hypothetical protein
MAAMKDLWEQINYLLDTTKWSCEEVANYVKCPVEVVDGIVEQRWEERIYAS